MLNNLLLDRERGQLRGVFRHQLLSTKVNKKIPQWCKPAREVSNQGASTN
ncbi:MAG TPA: hypothetical protein VK184_27480 [Nostocaceae cyanobacterium]|nr:hypothetical protein [Nostocaceae cyanobacterium]